jgi:excisionase family DNA binding protein
MDGWSSVHCKFLSHEKSFIEVPTIEAVRQVAREEALQIISTESLLLDLKNASRLLGISIWTLRDLINAGTIAAHRIGRKDFVRRADLVAFASRLAA